MTTSEISFDNIPPFTGNFSSVSATDLDEMFDKNLKLLNDFENHEFSSNSSSRSAQRYQSSLNIYISPQKNWRHSTGVYFSCYDVRPLNHSQCDTFKFSNNSVLENTSCQLTKSSLYSSYETLYDDLKFSKKNTEKTFETMSQSLLDTSPCSINQYLKSNRKQSSESDETLKSLSSRDSFSSVSSIDSQVELKEKEVKHFPTSVINFKNFHESTSDIPKLRPRVNNSSNIRPNSCYVDVKFGQYLTKPNNVFIKTQNSNDQSNIVISKPLGNYPNRSMNNYLSINTNNNRNNHNNNFRVIPSRPDQYSYNSSIKHLFQTKNKQNLSSNNRDLISSNILNNHFMGDNNNFQSISSKPCNNIPPNISQSSNQLEHINNHQNTDTNHNYNSNNNSKSDLKKQISPITIDQNRKPTNNIITNLQRSNQNFSIPIKNVSGNKSPSNEKNLITKSKSYQIERTNGKV